MRKMRKTEIKCELTQAHHWKRSIWKITYISMCIYLYRYIYRTLSRMCNELYRNCHGTGPGLWKTVCCSALFRERP